MTGTQTAFLAVGAVTLAAGAATLLRPSLARHLLKLQPSDAAAYALRIGGAMVAAFGLALIVLTLTVVSTTPAALFQGAV